MGALRWVWDRPRGARVVAVAGAVGGAVACDPAGLSSATVAYTTDQTVTKELERQNAKVSWLSCTASFGDGNKASTPGSSSPTEDAVANVDCQGRTDQGQDITVTGKVTRAVNGKCVRGDLTAKIDGKEWFHVEGLGDCDAANTPPVDNPQQPGATVTVTETKTLWCKEQPDCWPEGK
ncbi:hypothetical protein QQY66_15635 [Streptomyces sp. DG2A-72]|uniref:hypothetical protein n=1 Tax=Streptomyces sp. DG2A-72 TaxID=3051386 RepID=UPI00265BA0E5|nr:hypothetical protein [Streptomyces sp. DG2A-72]MDO0933053.1 hypothetical protein [Streptomyces sp. DG2A-72]